MKDAQEVGGLCLHQPRVPAAEPLLAELAVRPQADPWLTARGLRLLHHRNQPDPA